MFATLQIIDVKLAKWQPMFNISPMFSLHRTCYMFNELPSCMRIWYERHHIPDLAGDGSWNTPRVIEHGGANNPSEYCRRSNPNNRLFGVMKYFQWRINYTQGSPIDYILALKSHHISRVQRCVNNCFVLLSKHWYITGHTRLLRNINKDLQVPSYQFKVLDQPHLSWWQQFEDRNWRHTHLEHTKL